MTDERLETSVRLPDEVAIEVDGDDRFIARALAELDPYRPLVGGPAAAPRAELRIRSIQAGRRERPVELQLLAGDGHVTAVGEREAWLLDGTLGCSIPREGAVQEVLVERGFSVGRAFRTVVRPALQLQIARGGGVVVHASSVEIGGRAVLVAGWSESGKTETALALVEGGARFQSDKWTILTSGSMAAAFPISLGVRGWVLPFLPRLRRGLPAGARAQLRLAAAGRVVTTPLRNWHGGGSAMQIVAGAVRKAVALGDRAALTPSALRAIYDDDEDPTRAIPIGAIVVLRTAPSGEVAVVPGDPERLSRRLAISAATERAAYLALKQRAAYARAEEWDIHALIERDRVALERELRRCPLFEVSAPFPGDPRAVAAAVSRHL
ncbi:MAG TPA: hypothetical protein VFW95_00540 [Candidatus Limnocylindria bacterium]|nr:hypothetical protein [Candidatus Limnocylindria bacterium]